MTMGIFNIGADVTQALNSASSALNSAGAQNPGPGAAFADIKVNEVAPSDTSGMDANSVMDILHNLDVAGVQKAADAHTQLGETLDRIAGNLVNHAHTLAGSWQSKAAQAAVTKFQQMHGQAAQLAAQAKQTGQVLNWTAGIMQSYKDLPTPVGESATSADEHTGASIGNSIGGTPGAAIGDVAGGIAGALGFGHGTQAKANAQAQKYLDALNQHLVTANNAMPSPIGQAPANPGSMKVNAGGAGGGTVGGAGGGGIASGPGLSPYTGAGAGSGAASGGPSGIGQFNGARLPHGGQGAGATLQSYTPPPGGASTLPPPGTTTGAGPAGPVGMPTFVPAGPVPNGGNPAEEALAEDGALPGADAAAADGAAESGAIGDAAAGDAAASDAVPEMPGMTGAGTGAASDAAAAESAAGPELSTEPAFTDAAAGADGAAIGDSAIGDEAAMGAEGEGGFPMAGGAGAGQPDKERKRQAWMDEDADIWGVPKVSVGSVIDGSR